VGKQHCGNGIVYPTFHTICPRPSHDSLIRTHDPCSSLLSACPGRRARRCPVCDEGGDASVTIGIERRTEAAADGASSKTMQSWNAAHQAPHIRLVSLSERDQTGSSVAKPTHKTRRDSTNNQLVRNRVSRHAARNTQENDFVEYLSSCRRRQDLRIELAQCYTIFRALLSWTPHCLLQTRGPGSAVPVQT
jgi:hypothetical protein